MRAPSPRIRRLAEILRRGGPGALAQWVGYRLARRLWDVKIARVLWFEPPPQRLPIECGSGFVFRFLTAGEVRAFVADPACALDSSLAERLASGRDFCFAALAGGHLAAYAWFALHFIEPYHSADAGISLPPDVAYLYHAFTLAPFRGRRLHGQIMKRGLGRLIHLGVRKLVLLVEFTNQAALRSCRRLGCRDLGWLVTAGRRPHRLMLAPSAANARGIVFGPP